jgi:hypothetical protein
VYNDKKYTYNRKTGYKSNKAFFLSPSSIRRVAALYAAQTTPRTFRKEPRTGGKLVVIGRTAATTISGKTE